METPAARRWSTVLSEAEESELSLRAFARSRGLNPQTLAWWRWRLSQTSEEEEESGFVEAIVQPATELRVRVGEAVIEVEPDTDLALLARVVGALS